MRIFSGLVSHDMEFQIHCLETEAYGAVLKAFIAQSDVLSWGKEELITELRKELRVSDVEHRQILAKIHLDDTVKSIKEARNGADGQQVTTMNPPASDSMVAHASHKRLKHAHTPVASSPRFPHRSQPSSVSPPPLAMNARNDQWNNNTAVFHPQMNAGQALMSVSQNRQPPSSSGKLRGSVVVQTSRKGFVHSGSFGNMKSGPDIIEIRATDKVIHEVDKIFGVNPEPADVKRARSILREHERALMDAIAKLSNVSDGDDSPGQRQKQYQYSNDERQSFQVLENGDYEQPDRSKSIYYGEGYMRNGAENVGVRCDDRRDDVF